MTQLLGLVLLSFAVTSFVMVPFIDLLFYLKRRFEKRSQESKKSETPIHDQLMRADETTPSGAGMLLISILISLSIGYTFFNPSVDKVSLKILLFTLLSFGLLGFFSVNQFPLIHLIIFIITFFSWIFSQYTLAKLTNDENFVHFSKILILIESILGNLFLFFNYFNAISETVFCLLIFLWLTIFIGRYLK